MRREPSEDSREGWTGAGTGTTPTENSALFRPVWAWLQEVTEGTDEQRALLALPGGQRLSVARRVHRAMCLDSRESLEGLARDTAAAQAGLKAMRRELALRVQAPMVGLRPI